jgi:hypothetical protein
MLKKIKYKHLTTLNILCGTKCCCTYQNTFYHLFSKEGDIPVKTKKGYKFSGYQFKFFGCGLIVPYARSIGRSIGKKE